MNIFILKLYCCAIFKENATFAPENSVRRKYVPPAKVKTIHKRPNKVVPKFFYDDVWPQQHIAVLILNRKETHTALQVFRVFKINKVGRLFSFGFFGYLWRKSEVFFYKKMHNKFLYINAIGQACIADPKKNTSLNNFGKIRECCALPESLRL